MHEPRAALEEGHADKVVGWVRPVLSEGDVATIRERSIRKRFEHVDEYLAQIDELLQELAELHAVGVDTVAAIREARVAVMNSAPARRTIPRRGCP